MSTARVEQHLVAFDDAWVHPWESVVYALKDITQDEAQWQHTSYADVEIIEGEQLPGSALWHIVHIEQCERQYLYMTCNRCKPEIDTLAHEHAADLKLILVALHETHNDLRNAITELTDADLSLKISAEEGSRYNGMPMSEFLNVITRHNTWHAGQIMVARRLYREHFA